MRTILLKMAGPLQSWGTDSHFEIRRTDRYPSKSAIIGMLSASFGYRRDDTEDVTRLNDLDFAVRIDQEGQLLRDYHIAKKYKPDGKPDRNYVTHRYYLEDGVYIVAIGHRDHEFIREIENSLKRPYFQLFMGRRSLPVTADFFLGSTEKDVITSLKELPWQASSWYQNKHPEKQSLTVIADRDLVVGKASTIRRDRVLSFSNRGREFAHRVESETEVEIPQRKSLKEHDVFAVIGD